jgi:hypothetical protein
MPRAVLDQEVQFTSLQQCLTITDTVLLLVAKNGKNDVFSSYFSNHYCTKLKLVPTKLGIHSPLKTCLEYDTMRAAFK